MIHPATELKHINSEIGYGVFATAFIPKGTIVYVKDSLEVVIAPNNPLLIDSQYQKTINHYSYIDENGNRIISWDIAKYVNHCCNFNTLSTGYGFEIAIRDIKKGEEITDEYGLFNVEEEMDLKCSFPQCRKKLAFNDIDTHFKEWDKLAQAAIQKIKHVDQPLLELVEIAIKESLLNYLKTGLKYKSVLGLKYDKAKI